MMMAKNKIESGETIMLNPQRKLALAASLGAGIASFATGASALPVFDALAIRNAAPPTVEEVQWRLGLGMVRRSGCSRCGRRLGGRQCPRCALLRLRPVLLPRTLLSGPAACVLRLSSAGRLAILRRRLAILRQRLAMPPYRPALPLGDPVAYCKQRYRSYNPQTGTYLGTDGQRHHCP